LVDDVNKFLQYGQSHLNDPIASINFNIFTYSQYGIWEQGLPQTNESNFMQLISSEDMGLKLIKQNANGSEWEVKGTDANGNSITIIC
jgi:hypothetical protein